MPKIVIVLVGPIASGKGTVVELLKKGFTSYSFSDRIKEELKARNIEINRFSLNNISNELRQNLGADVLARRNAEIIDRENNPLIVIDGARSPEELKFLKEKYNTYIIGLTTDQTSRFERLKKRGLLYEDLTFEQFQELDNRELKQEGEYSQQVAKCLEMADTVVENNGNMEEFEQKLKRL